MHRSRRAVTVLALVAALALVLISGCGKDATTTDVGAGPGTGVTNPAPATSAPITSAPLAVPPTGGQCVPGYDPANPTTLAPGVCDGVSPSPPGGPTTTCVEGPATTIPGDPGGGSVTCTSPDDVVSSPPLTDTTFPPGPTAPGPQPDATNGVVRGQVGGAACPRSAEMCNAMFRFVPATVTLSGPTTVTVHTTDTAPEFGFAVKLPPGRYAVTAAPDQPNDCLATQVDVVAGQIADVNVDCAPLS